MNIACSRLRNQRIADGRHADPAQVVQWLGAVQAQDYRGSLWGVALRTREADEAAVEQALAGRRIVRTWPMRGTLHMVAAADVRWLLELLTPRVVAASAARHRQLELDAAVLLRCERILVEVLRGGRQVSRPAIYRLLENAGIATAGSRGLHILSYLAQRGVICFGAREGRQQTFVLLDEWVPAARNMERAAALGELTLRYFTSHGPATAHDLAWWAGLTLGEVRSGLEMIAPQLARESIGKRTYWFAASATAPAGTRRAAYLLPAFDEYTVAYRDRSDVLDARHAGKVSSGGMLNPVIVIDGQVVGTWKRALRRAEVVVTVRPFERLGRVEQQAVAEAAQRYGAFLGLRATIA